MLSKRILIVDDDFITGRIISRMLLNNEYIVVSCVKSGEEAIAIIQEAPIDLILMDIGLNGEKNGLETAKFILRHYNVPSLFVTSSSDFKTFEMALKISAYGYLVKPIKENDLLFAMKLAFQRQSIEKRTYKTISKLSTTVNKLRLQDASTKLLSRNGFYKQIVFMDTPLNLPLGLLKIDINGLNSINTAYGNNKGDIVLKKLADVLLEISGQNAIVARIGEDSFISAISNTSNRKMETLLKAINKKCFDKDYLDIPWSYSAGYAVKEASSDTIEDTYLLAQRRLNLIKLTNKDSMRSTIVESAFVTFISKNRETKEHCFRLKKLSENFGLILGLDQYTISKLVLLSLLHDIGKVGIPEAILTKEGTLTKEEWEIIKMHSEIGYKILIGIEAFSEIATDALYVHEAWNGSGYPDNLSGNKIPLCSRIIAIIDAYDAMISDRCYRKALSIEEALNRLKLSAKKQFDPVLVKKFIKMIEDERCI